MHTTTLRNAPERSALLRDYVSHFQHRWPDFKLKGYAEMSRDLGIKDRDELRTALLAEGWVDMVTKLDSMSQVPPQYKELPRRARWNPTGEDPNEETNA